MDKYKPTDTFGKVSEIAELLRWHEIKGPVDSATILKFARQVQRVLIHEDMDAILKRAQHHKDFRFTAPDSYQLRNNENAALDRAWDERRNVGRKVLSFGQIKSALTESSAGKSRRSKKNRV